VTVSAADATAHDFEAVSASDTPLLFSWQFLQLLSTATGYPNRSVVLQRGDRRFLLPVLRRRALGIYPLDFSLPFGHHGAIFPEPAAGAEYAELIAAARRHLHTGIVLQNCAQSAVRDAGLATIASHTTHLLHTRGTTYDQVFATTFDAKLRNQIRKAEKSSLGVVTGNDAEAIRQFYELYLLSNARWGRKTPKYPREFFEAFTGAPFFETKLALHEGRPIGGIVVLKFRDQHLYCFGAMDKAHGILCPNHLLISLALRDAIAQGTGFFNFGASGKLASVRTFKESFGAQACTYATYFAGNPLVEAALRYRMRDA